MTVYTRSRLASLFGSLYDRINREGQYPETEALTPSELYELYLREPSARRAVELEPLESWCPFLVYEKEESDEATPFEQAFYTTLNRLCRFREPSYYVSDNSPVHEVLRDLDVLAGIGRYGVLLLIVDDGRPLHEPLVLEPSAQGRDLHLLGLVPLYEGDALIASVEGDKESPRYGMPLTYQISIQNCFGATSFLVHWSRILHVVVSGGRGNEIYGRSRLLPILNRLIDIRRIYASSAVMYWAGAFMGLVFEAVPGEEVEIDRTALETEVHNYFSGLQRYLALSGLTAKPLNSNVVAPKEFLEPHIDAICVALGVPKRIFVGSERGELASSQDEVFWRRRMAARREFVLAPNIVAPFVNRLINVGILPVPQEGFRIYWRDTGDLPEDVRAQVILQKTQAMAQYVSSGVDMLMSPDDYLTRILGFTEDETRVILARTQDHAET